MLDEIKMQRTLIHVLGLLVSSQYEALEKLSDGIRLSAETMRLAIEEWPETGQPDHFIMPPTTDIFQLVMEDGFEPIPNQIPETWMLEVYLWTVEQGQSDLSLRLTVKDKPGKLYCIEVDDILVM